MSKLKLSLVALAVSLLGAVLGHLNRADAAVFTFSGLNKELPDGTGLGVFDQRTIDGITNDIVKVRVSLEISGAWSGDLYAYLNMGTAHAVLLNRVGCTATNPEGYNDPGFNVWLDDQAPNGDIHQYRATLSGDDNQALPSALSGDWAPDGRAADPGTVLDTDSRSALLSAFSGLNPNGTWTLFVADMMPGSVHHLVSWKLDLQTQETGTTNHPPKLEPVNNWTIEPEKQLNFTLSATDPDGDALTYAILSGAPSGATLDRKSGVFSWRPTKAQDNTTNVVQVQVADAGNPPLTDSASFTIVVKLEKTNQPPVIILSNSEIEYKNAKSVAVLDDRSMVQDDDSPNFDGGQLTVRFVSGSVASDHLAILDQGTGKTNITLVTTNVYYGANLVGWFGGGANGTTPLLVNLNTNATSTNVQALVRCVTYQNDSLLARTNALPVEFMLSDGDGATSAPVSLTINVTIAKQIPVITWADPTAIFYGTPLGSQQLNAAANVPGTFRYTPEAGQVLEVGEHQLNTAFIPDDAQQYASVVGIVKILVKDVNKAPVLIVPIRQTVNELAAMNVTVSATDADLPANTLVFALVTAPTGMTINASTGAITWTPTEAQGPSTNTVTVKVTDDGEPSSLSATNSFTVEVTEVNSAPTLVAVADQTIAEFKTLVVTNLAMDTDIPLNKLTFTLVAAPEGMTLESATGILRWTPTEGQWPSTNTVIVKVTDDGVPSLSATNSFTVIVTPPADLFRLAILDVVPGVSCTLRWKAEPGVKYRLLYKDDVNAPQWNLLAVLNSSTNEAVFVDRALKISKRFYRVEIGQGNTAPIMAIVHDRTVAALTTLVVTNTATDADIPANKLTFGLVSAPDGMTLDSTTGVLRWTPTEAQGPSTNTILVKVTDDGEPTLSATNKFTVIVTPRVIGLIRLERPVVVPGVRCTLRWNSEPGIKYRLLYKDELNASAWKLLGELSPSTNEAVFVDEGLKTSRRFYIIEVAR